MPAELQTLIVDALRAARPLTTESAAEIVAQTLESVGAGREAKDFAKWYEVHGPWLVERINA